MSDCTVCDDAILLEKATCYEKDFRWHILKTLCYLTQVLTEEEEEADVQSVILPQVTKTFAQLQASYAAFAPFGFLDTTKRLRHIRIVNSTDADLEFSYDGGDTVAFRIIAGYEYIDDFNLTMASLNSFVMRRVSGDSATNGFVLIQGRY